MSSPDRQRGGRRRTLNVPCEDCILRASASQPQTNVDLCDSCSRALQRPRPAPQRVANTRQITRTDTGRVNSARKKRTGPAAKPSDQARRGSQTQTQAQTQTSPESSSADHDTHVPASEQIRKRMPTYFETLHDARLALDLIQERLKTFTAEDDLNSARRDPIAMTVEKRSYFGPLLDAWERAFSQFLARNSTTIAPDERRRAMVLKSHHIVAEISANVDVSRGASGWAGFRERFNTIVDLATAVLEDSGLFDRSITRRVMDGSNDSHSLAETDPLSDRTLIGPLREVSTQCTDPTLQQRAQMLFERHFRRGPLQVIGSPGSSAELLTSPYQRRSTIANAAEGGELLGDAMVRIGTVTAETHLSGRTASLPIVWPATDSQGSYDPREGLRPAAVSNESEAGMMQWRPPVETSNWSGDWWVSGDQSFFPGQDM